MRLRRQTFPALVVLAFLASCEGCFGCKTSPIDDPELELIRSCQSNPPTVTPPKLDILFVIDNSNSMREEQEGVAQELTAFVDELRRAGGVPADFNIGVVTTSVYLHGQIGNSPPFILDYPGQEGRLRPVPAHLDGGLIDYENPEGERLLRGDDPDLIEKFDKLVRQGVSGSGQETPFEATRLALLSDLINVPISEGGNGGLLRDGARVLIVVLTDEDDCSEMARPPVVSVGDNAGYADCTEREMELTPVSEYRRQLTQDLKNSDGTAKEVIWTAIAPVSINNKSAQAVLDTGANQVRNVDCATSNQAGYRLRAMAEAFDNTLINLDSICRESYRDTLINIAQLAGVVQSLTIDNVPDPGLLQLTIKRANGSDNICTTGNGGIANFSRSNDGEKAVIQFGNQCRRRADDVSLTLKVLCAL